MKSQIHELKNLITKKMSKNLKSIALIAIVILAISCKKSKVDPNAVTANFTTVDDSIPYGIGSNLVFDFTNTSTNATSYRWDFGGGYSATTTNAHISYTSTNLADFFTMTAFAGGNYYTNQVKLTAKNGTDSSVITKRIVIVEEF